MAHLAGPERRQRRQRPAAGRYARDALVVCRRHQNRVVRRPRFAARREHVGDGDGSAAAERHLLQLALREEADPSSIRREERIRRVLGARQHRRFEAIECTRVQLDRAVTRIDSKVKMGWSAGGVAGIAHIAQHSFRRYVITGRYVRRIRIKMCVIVDSPARTDYGNSISTKRILTDSRDITIGRRKNRSASSGKDVLTLV